MNPNDLSPISFHFVELLKFKKLFLTTDVTVHTSTVVLYCRHTHLSVGAFTPDDTNEHCSVS